MKMLGEAPGEEEISEEDKNFAYNYPACMEKVYDRILRAPL